VMKEDYELSSECYVHIIDRLTHTQDTIGEQAFNIAQGMNSSTKMSPVVN
jgi:hypothetical protein